jgi:hypothetical protein
MVFISTPCNMLVNHANLSSLAPKVSEFTKAFEHCKRMHYTLLNVNPFVPNRSSRHVNVVCM